MRSKWAAIAIGPNPECGNARPDPSPCSPLTPALDPGPDGGDGTSWLECLGDALCDDRLLFDAIAPFVKAGSFIEMSGEDGTLWRWHFDGKQCQEQLGHVVFGESARVLITVRSGVGGYVTDGNAKVALMDYDNEPDVKITAERNWRETSI